jgi:aminoglycoside phosphotransferase
MTQEDRTTQQHDAKADINASPERSWTQKCLGTIFHIIQTIWTQLPSPVRASAHTRLAPLSVKLYGYTGSDCTLRLPFNLYLRVANRDWEPKHRAESEALRLVHKYTHIPAPKIIDVVTNSESSFLLMTGLPGTIVGRALPTMTDKQVETLARDLKIYVSQLRHIPNNIDSGFANCNALGGGILDWHIGDSQREVLRFATEDDLNKYLTYDLPFSQTQLEQIEKAHSIQHDIVFTHADLNPRNILVDENMKICGIVDWECAGWYPEYWEYTKAHFTVRVTARWIVDVLDWAFTGYRDELQVEDMLASLAPSW